MKNQYCGDVNAYRKYGLLRCFSEARFALGICWVLTSDGTSSDGQKTRYLQEPAAWRGYDPELFDVPADRVRSGVRSVREFEESGHGGQRGAALRDLGRGEPIVVCAA